MSYKLAFEDSVSLVPLIGDKYEKLLEKLNIFTVRDLLYHFPSRYEDYSKVTHIEDLKVEEVVTVQGTLVDINNIFTKNGKRLTKGLLQDDTGIVQLIWFNQHYLKQSLPLGEFVSIAGKVESFDNKPCFFSPDYEVLRSGNPVHSARIVPVYSETRGVSSKWLRSRINYVLSRIQIKEFMPEFLLEKNELIELQEAMQKIHFPNNMDEVYQARKRFGYEEMFEVILKQEIKRQVLGHTLVPKIFENKQDEIEGFISELPFELTGAQKRSINEITTDMQKDIPMNRLLQGDVGAGKTIVAVTAAYYAYLNNTATLYMAPTEILATQHYASFKRLLEPLGIKVGLCISAKKEAGNYDIWVGTHALLFREQKISNLGLVIIDEQHRFGVEQRAKLSDMIDKTDIKTGKRIKPHTLTMTATPIPRTVALTIYSDLDLSVLDEVPANRIPVTTWVLPPTKRFDAYEWVCKQIRESNGENQVFIVCPLIDVSESESLSNVKAAKSEYQQLKLTHFRDLELGLLHGKMKSKEKEEIIEQFKSKKLHALVATPVIEVGIDIPSATIVVIEASERFGLASLHQIRGRVGRGNEKSYCLLFSESKSPKTMERLKLLEKHTNGMELAEKDFELRGPGDMYGTAQSGLLTFKVANLTDTDLIHRVKEDVALVIAELDKYRELVEKVEDKRIVLN